MPFSSVLELLHTRKVTRAALTVVGLAPKFRVVSGPPSSTNIMPDLALLRSFELTEILSEEPDRCRLTLLGTLPSTWETTVAAEDRRLPAIIRIEKNAFASEHIALFFKELVHKTEVMGSTDI